MSSEATRVEVRRGTAEEVLGPRWRVLRPGRPRETARFDGDEAPGTRHWVVAVGDAIVGCLSVMEQPFPTGPGPALRLRGMAVDADRQRQGLGARLLEAAHAEVGAPMWCDARLIAVPFYEAGGWTVVSDRYEIAGIGPHHRMIWPGPR